MSDLISRQGAIDALKSEKVMMTAHKDGVSQGNPFKHYNQGLDDGIATLMKLPSAQQEIAENLYPYKCYITDKDGLQHEVIHTGDIRRVTGWEI